MDTKIADIILFNLHFQIQYQAIYFADIGIVPSCRLLLSIFSWMGKLTGLMTKKLTEPIIGIILRMQTHVGLSNQEYKEALLECVQENEWCPGSI